MDIAPESKFSSSTIDCCDEIIASVRIVSRYEDDKFVGRNIMKWFVAGPVVLGKFWVILVVTTTYIFSESDCLRFSERNRTDEGLGE